MRLLVALFLIFVANSVSAAERRVALVMGADAYRTLRPLENAVNDATAVEAALVELGFEVSLETNRDLRRMRRALDDFREDAAGADVALVFFAGHGVEIGGNNRLLPVDADASSIELLRTTTLPLEDVRDVVTATGKVGIVMLDACRDDPFGSALSGGRSAASLKVDVATAAKPGLARMGRSENVLFAFSASPGQTAADGADGNSPFSAALKKYLGTEGLEIRSVLTLVQQEVYDLTRGGQLPYVESGLPQLFFASAAKDELPERERLLLAMADISPVMRRQIEEVAARYEVPLAPLFGAFLGADLGKLGVFERNARLGEAAKAFNQVRGELKALSGEDPEVERLRGVAEAQLSTGQFDAARESLLAAAEVDARSLEAIEKNLEARTVSLASTHIIAANAAQAALRYKIAEADFETAFKVLERIDLAGLPDAEGSRVLHGMEGLSLVYAVLGRFDEATGMLRRRLELARERFEKDRDNEIRMLDFSRAMYFELTPEMEQIDDKIRQTGDDALDISRKLFERDRDNSEYAFLFATAAGNVAIMAYYDGDDRRSLDIAHGAIDMVTGGRLLDAAADDRVLLAAGQLHIALGRILILADIPDEAVSNFRRGLDYIQMGASRRPYDLVANATLGMAYLALTEGLGWTGELGEVLKVLAAGRERMLALQASDAANPAWPDMIAMFDEHIESTRDLIVNCGEDGERCKVDHDEE